MTSEARVLELPVHVTRRDEDRLLAFLREAAKSPVEISAGKVKRLGTRCVEVLMSARTQWQRDGAAFRITGASDAFRECLACLGLPSDFFDSEAV